MSSKRAGFAAYFPVLLSQSADVLRAASASISRTLIDANKGRGRSEHVREEQKNKWRIKSQGLESRIRIMALVGLQFSEDFSPRFDGCPPGVSWRYDRKEMLVDGIVHFVGLGLALVGAAALFLVTYHSANGIEAASVTVYVVGLLAMLGCSAAYNLWPISPTKWLLRRFDHSAIFLFIAATYTPLITPKSEPENLVSTFCSLGDCHFRSLLEMPVAGSL